MRLDSLPGSPRVSRRSLLPQVLLTALALAVPPARTSSALDQAQVAQAAPLTVPTGTLATITQNTTQKSRQAYVNEVARLALGDKADANVTYKMGFKHKQEELASWQVNELMIGFMQKWGIHVVTYKTEGVKTFVYDMADVNHDGIVDRVESSVSWTYVNEQGNPMTHKEASYVLDQSVQDMYAAALRHATHVLKAEKQVKDAQAR